LPGVRGRPARREAAPVRIRGPRYRRDFVLPQPGMPSRSRWADRRGREADAALDFHSGPQ